VGGTNQQRREQVIARHREATGAEMRELQIEGGLLIRVSES
jgi:hypothetical protein